MQPDLIKFYRGELIKSVEEGWQYAIPLDLASMYIADAVDSWLLEFEGKVDAAFSRDVWLSIVVISVMVVAHVCIFEMFVMSTLKKDYNFMKSVFSACVSESILTQEKIIKHRFYQSGILRAN